MRRDVHNYRHGTVSDLPVEFHTCDRCSPQPRGPFPSISANLSPFGCRPSRIASTMSGARQVSGRSRHTYALVTPSCSARSVIDRACLHSTVRRQQCARTEDLVRASSRAGGFQGRLALAYRTYGRVLIVLGPTMVLEVSL